jgi:hypothetical protein
MPAQSELIMLQVLETKSPSSPHSRAPARLRPRDRTDSCSNAIARATRTPLHRIAMAGGPHLLCMLGKYIGLGQSYPDSPAAAIRTIAVTRFYQYAPNH